MTPEERIDRIRSDHWIAFDRATIVLNRLTSLMEMPQQSRMPGLMVYGSSGIGKTMIAKRMASKYPTQYNADLGITKTPILLVQAPPAPDERRFYQHILSTIGAPMWGRHTVSELEVRALSHLRDMDLKMLMIDEVHNLLAGSYREQRRFLNIYASWPTISALRLSSSVSTKPLRPSAVTTNWPVGWTNIICRSGRMTWSSLGSFRR